MSCMYFYAWLPPTRYIMSPLPLWTQCVHTVYVHRRPCFVSLALKSFLSLSHSVWPYLYYLYCTYYVTTIMYPSLVPYPARSLLPFPFPFPYPSLFSLTPSKPPHPIYCSTIPSIPAYYCASYVLPMYSEPTHPHTYAHTHTQSTHIQYAYIGLEHTYPPLPSSTNGTFQVLPYYPYTSKHPPSNLPLSLAPCSRSSLRPSPSIDRRPNANVPCQSFPPYHPSTLLLPPPPSPSRLHTSSSPSRSSLSLSPITSRNRRVPSRSPFNLSRNEASGGPVDNGVRFMILIPRLSIQLLVA